MKKSVQSIKEARRARYGEKPPRVSRYAAKRQGEPTTKMGEQLAALLEDARE